MRFSATAAIALGLSSLGQAARLYVSSYSGNITTIDLTETKDGVSLKAIALSQGCAPSPSWLEYNSKTSTLYCADEGFTHPENATFSSFKTETNGSLTSLNKLTTLNGGVSTVSYGDEKERLMAIAHYGGSGISIVNTTTPSSLDLLKTYSFIFSSPQTDGTKPKVPFIHQVILDPTKKFLLAPDLSADLVHVFGLDKDGMLLDPAGQAPLAVHPNSGPRHLVFYQPGGNSKKTYIYLVLEKANLLHGYEVLYNENGTLDFKNVYMGTVFGGDDLPVGAAAAEINLTPDNRYIIVSSRNDIKFPSALNPNPTNKTPIKSDTLITFSLDSQTGIPVLQQQYPAGGLGPRSFSVNKKGDRVAVGLNVDNRVVILERDVKTGNFTKTLGSLDLDVGAAPGLVSSVIWAEEADVDAGKGEGGSVDLVVPTISKTVTLPGSSSAVGTVTKSTALAKTSTSAPDSSMSAPASVKTATGGSQAPSSSSPAPAKPTAVSPSKPASSLPAPVNTNPVIESKPGYFTTALTPTGRPDVTPSLPTSASTAAASPSPAEAPSKTKNMHISTLFKTMDATPSSVQTGISKTCHRFYQVQGGDTCEVVCAMTSVAIKNFYEWNPAVGPDCSKIEEGSWVCVGLEG